MRALTFLFALMVGLATAFLAPAMAGGHGQTPAAMVAPAMADPAAADAPITDALAADSLTIDLLSSDLLADLSIDPAPGLDVAA